MQVAWLTDIHFDRVKEAHIIDDFLDHVAEKEPDAILISGDIGEADSTQDYLRAIDARLKRPVYFVLGNHDYYYGEIAAVRAGMARFSANERFLNWLPCEGVVELEPGVALVGHSGWADGRYGNYARSEVMIGDYKRIVDLKDRTPAERLPTLNSLGDEAATYLAHVLPQALARYQHVIVLTHVPPFQQACGHNRTPDPESVYSPHFACKATGDVLLQMADAYPHREIAVLCGHMHGGGSATMRPNLHVTTGTAKYGAPTLQQMLSFVEVGSI